MILIDQFRESIWYDTYPKDALVHNSAFNVSLVMMLPIKGKDFKVFFKDFFDMYLNWTFRLLGYIRVNMMLVITTLLHF